MEQVGKIIKDEEGYLWCVRDDSFIDGCVQDMVGADIEHERIFLDRIRTFASKEKVFIDIGAHVGYYTIRLSKYFRSIYSIEPSKYNCILLNTNRYLNDLVNIIIEHNAIGKFNEVSRIYNRGSVSFLEEVNSLYKTDKNVLFDQHNTVNVITLDNFISPIKKDFEMIIKIDTEGMELDILEGGIKFLKDNKNILLIEHHDSKIKGNKDNIIKFLNNLDYYSICNDLPQESKIFMTNIEGIK